MHKAFKFRLWCKVIYLYHHPVIYIDLNVTLNIMYNVVCRWNSLQDADWRSGLCLAFYLCYHYDLQVNNYRVDILLSSIATLLRSFCTYLTKKFGMVVY